jgi:hypothetical protein
MRKQETVVQAYTFDFVNQDGSIDTFDIGEFDDDGAAAGKARSALLASLSAVAVEVWREGARVAQIRRDGAPQRPPVYRSLAAGAR